MMKKRNLWMVMLLIFTLFTSGLQAPVLAADLGKQGSITVLGLDGANPILAKTTVQFSDTETATEALTAAVGESNVEFTDTSNGKMLTGINGVKAEGTNYWAFFINGVAAQVGSDTYVVQNGDQLTFRLTDWTKTPQNTVSLKVVNSDKNNVTDQSGIEVIGSPTAFQLLQVILGPDKVGYSENQYGKMITSINGIQAEGRNYWAFYVNDKMAEVGADSYQLQSGNQISFKLESWENGSGDGNTGGETNPNPSGGTVSEKTIQASVDSASKYVLQNNLGEWEVIALKQTGQTIPATYLTSVKTLVKEKQGKFNRITDTERYVLGILAAGGDPTNVIGYNLVEAIYNGNVTKQGLIGVSYALIALDSANFSIPESAQWTREKIVKHLLDRQNQDGGWAWDESATSDIDTTAMILTALAPYKEQPAVKGKVDAAIQYLSTQYQASKIDNSSTAAQAIIALTTLGVDANAAPFTGLVEYFLSFQNADGGFDWQGGDVSDPFTTSQGIQALAAYQLYTTGKGSLYQLPLVEQKPETEKPETQTPSEEAPVQTTPHQDNGSNSVKGHTLPNTATDSYNLLMAGLLIMLIGSLVYMKQRKRFS
ncbi:LPXTG-motif cell wall-anchored protein [Bacillus sp. SLBN-46]|uniref:DUF4430 domain-containing protein n=1 Tax=Bacillus sp. SLBN-46 TaxID=3042283 RepID=UPI002858A4FD|nr:DUF4430 domain-containing protein [Bacillus sp. SLBN-46]MDR6123843.1 LPXTG-motif cell wall-anchored protein [Bacillus sp. SLBN-46]